MRGWLTNGRIAPRRLESVKLQEQPLQVLVASLERPGEIVAREERVLECTSPISAVYEDLRVEGLIFRDKIAPGNRARRTNDLPKQAICNNSDLSVSLGRHLPGAIRVHFVSRLPGVCRSSSGEHGECTRSFQIQNFKTGASAC
jgi:hypothetical protein